MTGVPAWHSAAPNLILVCLFPVSNRSDSLEDERQKWHAGLDSLLQGNLDSDDLQVALSLASYVSCI